MLTTPDKSLCVGGLHLSVSFLFFQASCIGCLMLSCNANQLSKPWSSPLHPPRGGQQAVQSFYLLPPGPAASTARSPYAKRCNPTSPRLHLVAQHTSWVSANGVASSRPSFQGGHLRGRVSRAREGMWTEVCPGRCTSTRRPFPTPSRCRW